ncbi:MAG: class I SAM-dependent methyltransferase [Burkholderiaceae bacterium]
MTPHQRSVNPAAPAHSGSSGNGRKTHNAAHGQAHGSGQEQGQGQISHETGHGLEPVSDWVQRWSHLVSEHGSVLDLACGRGRHLRWFAARGHPVTGVDRSAQALKALSDLCGDSRVELVEADIENGPWPLMHEGQPRQFDAVVVCNYLWRPLFPIILQSLSMHGVLLYETFAAGNASVGRPSRPDFLLKTGELLQVSASLRVVAYEDGFCEQPQRFVQRIAALRLPLQVEESAAAAVTVPRYRL